ncbi:NF-X1-type zinc finger protein NFXL1-like [Dreissena polymorpha]|uniref:NF-X1-type zinc finger protein NFXL1-like n=1 Tax=Dreissena polymorpha TaxID=45954 RepID=UPI002264683A|nr:NF-X1-type zinc finger protein NFXL1-like [Dreissena polymorpha]
MSNKPAYLQGRGRGRGGDRSNQQQSATQNGRGKVLPGNTPNNSPGGLDPLKDHTTTGKTAEERFHSANEQHKESIKRHLEGRNGDQIEDSSDEEDLDKSILEKIFKTYSGTDGVRGEVLNIGAAQDSLLHSFRSGTSACLVCIDAIKKTDQIWSCGGCHAIFHIQCIQKWVKDGVYQQIYKADDNIRPESIPWHCPKCRLEYDQKLCPTRYLCYCGKVEDPKFDPWLVPHSCGSPCGKPLKPDCGHLCLLLCHPGGCPPCPQTVRAKCHCGRAAPQMRRCSARAWVCGGVCGRKLACSQHTCQQSCHAGDCQPCPMTSTQRCQCGKSSSVRPCASPAWSCDKVCGKRLSCGNHVCETVCHVGSCGECPRGGLRKCPCGKSDYNLPCTEDIPTCGDTCGRLLACGVHRCVQRCHQGDCGNCGQMRVKRCRCGQKEREVQCCKELLCETKCLNLRDCGRHPCKRKCCDGNCPSCEQMCNKPLGCKNHKCSSRCHKGRCYPCMETKDIVCNCKATKVTVPCGREKVTKPPRCIYLCQKPPACDHSTRTPHNCHFGECPPCRQVCGKSLPKCAHTCLANCHIAFKVRYKDDRPRAGPWEGAPQMIEKVVDKPCPPCMVPMTMMCYGKHETGTFACSVVQPYQCGRRCGRQLACGNHKCSLMCHTVEGANSPELAGTNCEVCEVGCQFERPEGCTHECPNPCHPGPCPDCRQMFRMRCHCQVSVQFIECFKWVASNDRQKEALKVCGGPCPKQISCGHQCSLPCHAGPCTRADQCERKTTIRCKCRRQKREVKCRNAESEKANLQCDEKCLEEQDKKKKVEDEERRKLQEEEEKKQRAELEEFERKTKGRKRRPRKNTETVVEESFLSKHKSVLIICVSVVALAVFVYYLMNVS